MVAYMERITLYEQIKGEILSGIVNSRWSPGDMLPSEFELAAEYGVSQGTVRKALNELTAENVLYRKQGKGTYVSASGELRFWGYFRLNNGKGQISSSERLSVDKMETPSHVADYFSEENTHCFKVCRVRCVEEIEKVYEVLYLPFEIFPMIEETPSLNRFLYQYYEKEYGIPVRSATHKIRAVLPDADCQKHLGIDGRQPVLLQEHIVYNLKEAVIEYREAYCVTDNMYYENKM